MTLGADIDLRDRISRVESDIEQLAKTLDGCRKAMLLSKVAVVVGVIWILANLIGVIRFDATATTSAIVAVIGGIVVFGSNSSTSKQTVAAIEDADRRRGELIDMIKFRVVEGGGLQELDS